MGALLREQWPQLALTLTADATQVLDLVARHSYGLMVLDSTLPGLDLPQLLARLRQAWPSQRLLVLADARTLAQRREALAWPSSQLLVPSHVLPQALAAALAPWLDVPSSEAVRPSRTTIDYLIASSFSPRELEVLRLVVADHCNEEIADQLCLSVRTVESHRRMLLQKSGTRTLVGLAARAVREGWVA